MIISDLNYLESVESSNVKGGAFNFFSLQSNASLILQSSSANAGNVALVSIGNTATSSNSATVGQVNL